MRQLLMMIALLLTYPTAQAQTMNVTVGDVTDQYPAAKAGEMTYTGGTMLTILNKTYTLSAITKMFTDETVVTDNNVNIVYNGTAAQVFVAGNVARYVEVTVNGAHVSINQTNADAVDDDEITYTLSGTTTDGSLTLAGAYKCTVSLNGVTLTNPNGAAINITNKKRIQISAKKNTENTLADGAGGSQKGCIYSKGQIQLQGNGKLTVTGNTAHAIKSGDYIAVKNLTLDIPSAVKDGISCNKYFQMKSGTVTISSVGDDGIQADLESDDDPTGETADHEDENSGNAYIDGGTLTVTVPSAAAGGKCIKGEGMVKVSGGTLTLNANGKIDTSDAADPSYTAGIKGTNVEISDGTVNCTVTGAAGRGITADNTLTTNGGTITINNSGAPQTISSDVKSAKGLKALHMALNGGTINITMTGNASKAVRAGDGTKTTTSGGGWGPGGGTKYTNITGSYTQGTTDGAGPAITITQKGSAYSSSSAKAIKVIPAITIYGGKTEVYTTSSGAEGLESKTSIDIQGGQHYFQCYDDCINSTGKIYFNGGVTVCYSNGNDAIDSNAGTSGAITIGNGAVMAYTTKGSPEEGFDCDNNSYIQITGTGYGISAGGSQGGGGSSSISNAKQGYYFYTSGGGSGGGWGGGPGGWGGGGGSGSGISFKTATYYTLSDASGNNLVTFSFAANCSSQLSLFTAKGMVKNSTYYLKSSTTEPTDATTSFHGLYLGSSAKGSTDVISGGFKAQ